MKYVWILLSFAAVGVACYLVTKDLHASMAYGSVGIMYCGLLYLELKRKALKGDS